MRAVRAPGAKCECQEAGAFAANDAAAVASDEALGVRDDGERRDGGGPGRGPHLQHVAHDGGPLVDAVRLPRAGRQGSARCACNCDCGCARTARAHGLVAQRLRERVRRAVPPPTARTAPSPPLMLMPHTALLMSHSLKHTHSHSFLRVALLRTLCASEIRTDTQVSSCAPAARAQ